MHGSAFCRSSAAGDLSDIPDSLGSVALRRPGFSLWRPALTVDAGAPAIVTFNIRDYIGADLFGVRGITPGESLRKIEDIP